MSGGTNDGTSAERSKPPSAGLSGDDREAIRKAGAEDARRSRKQQGLPERIEDPVTAAILAALIRSTRPRTKEAAQGHEGKPAA
jgi:hypothetical protein